MLCKKIYIEVMGFTGHSIRRYYFAGCGLIEANEINCSHTVDT